MIPNVALNFSIWYVAIYPFRNHIAYEPIESSPDPILNPHEDMTTSNHITSSEDDNQQTTSTMYHVPNSASIDSLLVEPPPAPANSYQDIEWIWDVIYYEQVLNICN